jgi:hypothetical protein
MNILNGNEAFAAMTSGQKIECRFIESDHDFDDIRNFPATVLIDAGYEFRIAVVYMTIGETQVPESIKDAPAKGIQCFLPSILTEVLSKSFKWKNSDSDLALMQRGQVHLVQQHAEIHAQALIKISGGSLENVQNSTSDDVEKKTFDSQSNIQITEQGPITEVKESLVEEFVETDAVKLVEKFTAEINAAETVDAVMQIRSRFNSNNYMVQGQIIELRKLGEKRIAALTGSIDDDGEITSNGIGQQVEDYQEHKERLDVLLNDVALAQTPTEANALLKYTKHWTAEQRTPVIQAINKRLVELNPIAEIKIEETPSLMVQIQNAPDLTALDVLEIDVGSRHLDIQPKLMSCVTKRRFELENGINAIEASV